MNLNLDALVLDKGDHPTPDSGVCLLEATALFAGEPFGDHPQCVSKVLIGYGISLNDQFDDARRQELKPFIPRLPGTSGDGQDEARSYLALDWLIRTYTPAFLDLRPELADAAAELRSLRRIVDLAAAESAGPVVRSAQHKSYAAGAAARDAARTAAGAAAWDAARDAARDAAGAAAWTAAGAASWDAARDAAGAAAGAAAWTAAGAAAGAAAWTAAEDAARTAARAAARDAAWDAARAVAWAAAGAVAWDAAEDAARTAARAAAGAALRPTVDQLQNSAIALFERMVNPAEVTA